MNEKKECLKCGKEFAATVWVSPITGKTLSAQLCPDCLMPEPKPKRRTWSPMADE